MGAECKTESDFSCKIVSMYRIIVKKELKEILGSARFRWSAGLFIPLLILALLDGVAHYRSEHVVRAEASEATYRQWLEQGEKNPHSAAHYGFYAYKPLSPLSILDRGLDDHLGNAVWLEAHNQNEAKTRAITDMLSLSRFGPLTAGLLHHTFLPLLLIVLGYNLVSRERESQTLRLLLSTGASPSAMLRAKALALFICSLVIALPGFAAMAITVALESAEARWTQLILLFGCLIVLYAFFSMAVVAVSALSRFSPVSLVSLMAFWLAGVVIVPRLSGTMAKRLAPTPSAFAFQKAVDWDRENGLDGHDPGSERGRRFEREVLERYGVDSVEQLPVNFAGLSLQAGEEYANLIYDRHFGALFDAFRRQDRFIGLSALFSPLMAARATTYGFAGTDLARHESFVRQAEDKRRHVQKFLNDDFAVNAVGKDFSTYLKGKELWSMVTAFKFIPHTTSELMRLQSLNMMVLLLWTMFAAGLLAYSAKNLNPSL